MTAARTRIPRVAWLAAGVAAGAGGVALGVPAVAVVATGPAFVAAATGLWTTRAMERAAALAAAGIGLTLVGARMLVGPSPGVPPPLAADSRGPWVAIVESVGSPRDGDQVARLRLGITGTSPAVAATLPAYPRVAAGTVIEVEGRLRPPPEDDPYGQYLLRSGASGSLDVTRVRIVREASGTSLQALRDDAGDALRLALPEPEAGLAAGILIGLRERVDRDLARDFATAGTSHVVAISGWNIAIVAGIVGAAMRGRSRRLIAVVVGGTIAAYVVAAGASPSVVRAAVMASVVLVARESGRAGRAPAALAWAAMILLLASPEMIGDAGFRLSVLATAGLLAWATPLGGRIGRFGGGRVPRWLAESLGISLAAQAATLPDVLATFGRLSLVSPAVNLLVVPLVPPAMAGGVLALAGGVAAMLGAPAWLATLIGLPGWLLLHVMVAVVRIGAGLPLAAVVLPPALTAPAGLTAAFGLGAVLAWRHRPRRRGRLRTGPPARRRGAPARAASSATPRVRPALPRLDGRGRAALLGVVLVATISSAAIVEAATRETRLTVLDVGQGDAILLESRTGARMLVDGGPDPQRLLVELDARVAPWDRRLDIVVLTHPHEDHVAGLAALLDRYTVRRVFENGMHGPGPGWAAWNARLSHGPPRGILATGASIRLGEIRLTVLWPDPGTVPREPPDSGTEINDRSVVMLGTANGRSFLLTGDAEQDVDPELVARGLPRIDVLKVAHHGSATATTQAFLDATRPRIALISVGAGNTYGHPAPATVTRLRATGAQVYRTDRDGTVTVDLRPDGVVVQASGARRAASAARTASLGYDPVDDRPPAPRGRPAADLPRAARVVPAPFVRRGRPRHLACDASRGDRPARGYRARRRGSAAPRRGQAALGRGPGPPAPW